MGHPLGVQGNQGSGGRRWVWIVPAVVAVPIAFGVVLGLRATTDDDGGGADGSDESCPDPTFTVDVKTFSDDPIDPINVPEMFNVSLEGTVTMTGEHPVNVGSVVVPMVSSPDALVYGNLGDDRILEPGETASFTGSGPVELTGSPVVIPDDASARVDWQYEDVGDYVEC
jgi:hypothetical protein